MRRYGPAVLLLLTGAAILRISLFSELYLRYVQAGLRPYLVASGCLLVLLAVAAAVVGRPEQEPHAEQRQHAEHGEHAGRDQQREHGEHDESGDDSHAHDQHGGHHSPRVAWLLTLPALALLLFPPPALGSYSAEREAGQRAAQGIGHFPALPAGNPVELTLAEFGSRAVYDSGRSLAGRTVRLTGFVTRDDGTWYVTRLLVACCAADATTSKVEIRDADAPPADAWVTVTGTWRPKGELGTDEAWPPVLDAVAVRRIAQPANPYEKR
ncbi:membrane protein [Streptomyces viridochromogenes]|uniref:Membrane protein n=1 Tax=Streptomyces viridochromogenes TaxID=1938 RepID=A0A0J7YZ39_STRVR|nr:TIGR03943 family protein [Streptomyces viridochromogenes]KMS68921.1 membrane protein [Streptomyces viridochromogenes]KOG11424.1 membrane protein [Streptomyces viridochromogenes]KOG11976.1 membrane protein [Streptomyces viridochromogenes]